LRPELSINIYEYNKVNSGIRTKKVMPRGFSLFPSRGKTNLFAFNAAEVFKGMEIKTPAHAYAKGKQKYLQSPRNWVKGYCTHTHSVSEPGDFLRGVIFHEKAYAKTALPPLAIFPLPKTSSSHHVPLDNYFWHIFNGFFVNFRLIFELYASIFSPIFSVSGEMEKRNAKIS